MAKRKGNRKFFIIGLFALIALLVVGMIFKNRNKEEGERVMVEKVQNRTLMEQVSASGKVFPEVEVKISSDVSGEIVELYVEEGDSVIQGQLLAKIDPDAYQSQVERGVAGVNASKAQVANSKSQIEQQKAQKAQINAQLVNAREIHERNEKLQKDGVISEADFQASLSSLRGLEANMQAADANIKAAQESVRAAEFQVASSQATLRELKTSLRRTTIYAPTNAVVSMLNVEQGERVVGTIQMAGTEMMRLADLSAMEVRVDVSENDIPRVSLGDDADIEIDAYLGRKFKGKVSQIAQSASGAGVASISLTSDQVTNFEVRIRLSPESYQDLISPQKPYPFRPGMSASVDIITEVKSDVPTVPIQSVTTREKDGDKKKTRAKLVSDKGSDDKEKEKIREELEEVVFLSTEADTVSKVAVKTGIQDDTYIEVLGGVKAGDEIVVGPYSAVARKLKSGEKIIKVDPDKFYEKN